MAKMNARYKRMESLMTPEIQAAVDKLMETLAPENVEATTDIAGYRSDFLALHGFEG